MNLNIKNVNLVLRCDDVFTDFYYSVKNEMSSYIDRIRYASYELTNGDDEAVQYYFDRNFDEYILVYGKAFHVVYLKD